METSLQISQPYRAAMELRIAAAAVAPGCVVDQRNNRRLFVDLELILVGLINLLQDGGGDTTNFEFNGGFGADG
ncbi:hypothetical protein L6452_13029 [Arctium lappa]|uniref:Uncharacterized protein n=1 Tax=Arctium lappa TaxID=4217 RepID=A0ACB9CH50_ARCLA|nr:hypothetical protein L6452_13029 [Arctium lappa]